MGRWVNVKASVPVWSNDDPGRVPKRPNTFRVSRRLAGASATYERVLAVRKLCACGIARDGRERIGHRLLAVSIERQVRHGD